MLIRAVKYIKQDFSSLTPEREGARVKMCKECLRIKARIEIKRDLFEEIKSVSSKEYNRGFRNGHVGLLDEDLSNTTLR